MGNKDPRTPPINDPIRASKKAPQKLPKNFILNKKTQIIAATEALMK